MSPEQIEAYISEDAIVVVACPSEGMPALHGKFVKKTVGDQTLYSFCPFKKGLSLPFLTADMWQPGDPEQGAKALAQALLGAKKSLKGG